MVLPFYGCKYRTQMFNASSYSSLLQLLVSKVPTLIRESLGEVFVGILNTRTHFYILLANLYMTSEGNKCSPGIRNPESESQFNFKTISYLFTRKPSYLEQSLICINSCKCSLHPKVSPTPPHPPKKTKKPQTNKNQNKTLTALGVPT